MNDLTRDILATVAKEFPELALENGAEFRERVRDEYWSRILDLLERRLCDRAVHLWSIFIPDDFTEDGEAHDYNPAVFNRGITIFEIILRIMERKIEREPDLQLQEWDQPPQPPKLLNLF